MIKVSVVICAHDRQEFVLDALKSVVNQTLSRDLFEIILVKNFYNQKIDQYAKENDVINIYTEGAPPGIKMAEGIRNSQGEIISFLDDDDMFTENKLEYIIEKFDSDLELAYFHNTLYFIDSEGDPIDPVRKLNSKSIKTENSLSKIIKFINSAADFNSSSITIRRSMMPNDVLELLEETHFLADSILFYRYIDEGHKVELDNVPLVYYRVHTKNTFFSVGGYDEFKKKFALNSNFYYNTLVELIRHTKNRKVKKCLECALTNNKVKSYISTGVPKLKITFNDTFKMFICGLRMDRRENLMVFRWAIISIFNVEKALKSVYNGTVKKYR